MHFPTPFLAVLVGTVVATTLWCVLTAFMQRGQVVEH